MNEVPRPKRSPRPRPLAAAALLAAIVLVAAATLPPPAAAREGWHGETLPAGLERGEKEGEYVWTKDAAVMVYVPPGAFPMGKEDGERNEKPLHEVWLDGYYIDKYEVSWGQWKTSGLPYGTFFTSRRLIPEPPDWGIIDDHPMNMVTWDQAKSYAAWAGKRLPTEAEWEKAARGTDGRTYPWGNDPPTPERAVFEDHPLASTSTAPVTCCEQGASPYGVFNMAGNVMEWCEDVYKPFYYAESPRENPLGQGTGRNRVLRGGAFHENAYDLRSYGRYRLLPVDRTPYMGFRTVVTGVKASGAE